MTPGPLNDGKHYYAAAAIRAAATVVVPLVNRGLLAVREDAEAVIVDFVVYQSAYDDYLFDMVFSGAGVSGSLRELRHTQWGDEDGYIPSPDGALIASAFSELATWFDCNRVATAARCT